MALLDKTNGQPAYRAWSRGRFTLLASTEIYSSLDPRVTNWLQLRHTIGYTAKWVGRWKQLGTITCTEDARTGALW